MSMEYSDKLPVTKSMPFDLQGSFRLVFSMAVMLFGIWMVSGFLPALAWALVIAIATWPLYEHLRSMFLLQSRTQRWGAPLFTLLVGAVLLVPLTAVTLQVTQEAQIVMQWLTAAKKSGLASPDWLAKIPFVGPFAAAWWQANLADPNAAAQWLGRLDTADVLAWSKAFGVQLLSKVITLSLTLLTLYFLYRDGECLAQQTLSVARRALGESGERYATHTVSTLRATVNGLVLVGLGEGVLLGGAYAVSGLAHPALLGALTGLLAIIPFAVPFIFIGASLVLLGQGNEGAALALFVFGVVVVFMADHFIRPGVIGGATRLPFLWVLLGILGGLETFGLLGLFLGPAVMAALISVWRDWTEASSLKRNYVKPI